MKGLSLANAWGLDKKSADEAKKMLEDGLKVSLAVIDQAHKLGLVSDEDFQKARLQLEIETIDGLLAEEKKLGESLLHGDVYNRYVEARAKLTKDPRAKEQIKDLDKRFETEKEEWIRRTADLDARKLITTIHAETEITKAKLEELRRYADLNLKIVDENEKANLQLKQQYISDESELNKWRYDQQLSSATEYYDTENALIEKNLQAQLTANEKAKESAYGKFNLTVQTSGKDSNAAKQAYVDLVLTLTQLENERVLLVKKSASERIIIEREAANSIKKIYEEAFKSGGVLSGSQAVAQKTLGVLSRTTLNMAQNVADAVTSISSSMENAFMNFFDHTSEGFLNWQNLITSILNDIIKELIKVYIVKQLIGGLQKLMGGSPGESMWSGFKYSGPMAEGGKVSLNKTYLVGERGPELFQPSTSGTIVPNGQLGGQPIINIYNNNGSNVSTQTKSDNGKLEIDVMIDQVVAGKLSKFGSSSNKAIRQNFSASQRLTAR